MKLPGASSRTASTKAGLRENTFSLSVFTFPEKPLTLLPLEGHVYDSHLVSTTAYSLLFMIPADGNKTKLFSTL